MSTKVADAMHIGVEAVDPDAELSKIASIMKSKDIGAVPVGRDDKLLGIITDRDIVIRAVAGKKEPAKLTAGEVMSKPVAFCRSNDTVEKAIGVMERNQVRRLPVIDDGKRLVGILSMGDISHCSNAATTAKIVSAVSSHHA